MIETKEVIPVSLRILNSFTIELNSKYFVEEILNEENELCQLNIKDRTFKLKDTFSFNLGDVSSVFVIKYIKKVNERVYLLLTEERNKGTYYITPILGKLDIPINIKKQLGKATQIELSKYCLNTYLVNAYLGSCDKTILNNSIYLKFRYSSHDTYQILEKLLLEHPLFIRMHEDNYFTYAEFIVPEEYREDILKFISGKYSKLSKAMKDLIIQFHNLKPKSIMYQILYKKEEYRKQLEKELGECFEGLELESIPNLEQETVDI